MKELADYGQKHDGLRERCPVRATLDVIRGRWKPSILHALQQGTQRFTRIQEVMPEVTAQALTVQLRQLEADGVIRRVVHAEVPARVEYSLTDHGTTLSAVMDQLGEWGEAYLNRQAQGRSGP